MIHYRYAHDYCIPDHDRPKVRGFWRMGGYRDVTGTWHGQECCYCGLPLPEGFNARLLGPFTNEREK